MPKLKENIFSVGLLLFISLFAQAQTDTSLISHLVNRVEALSSEKNKEDSIAIYLDIIKTSYFENEQLESYCTSFYDISKALNSKGYVQLAMKTLQGLENDGRQFLEEHYELSTNIRYEHVKGYYLLRDYDTCITEIEKSLNELRIPLQKAPLTEANFYNLLGVAYRAIGKPLQALDAYANTLQLRKEELGEEHDLVAGAYNNIGNAYVSLGLYNKGLESLEKAINIRKKMLGNEHPNLAINYLNIGRLYDDKGEYNLAIEYYKKALLIFQKDPSKYNDRIADIFNNLGGIYKNKGAFQEAEAYDQQAIQQYQNNSGDYTVEIGNVYTNWSNLARAKNDYTTQIKLIRQAIQQYELILEKNNPRIITARNNLGLAYAHSGDYERALAEMKSLVSLIENDQGQGEPLANLNNDIADVYYKLNNLPEAKAYNQKALTIQQNLFGNKSYKLAYTYNNLAQIAENDGNRDAALQYLQQALVANHETFTTTDVHAMPPVAGFYKYDYYINSLLQKAHVTSESGKQSDLLEAAQLYGVADSVLLQVRNELLSAEDKIRLAEKVHELSQGAIENYLQLAEATGDQGYVEKAFQISEENKNAVLAQTIAANQATHFAGIPDSLITLEDQLQSDINFYQLQLAEQSDSLKTTLYQNELFIAQQHYRDLVTQLENEFPAYYQLKYDRTLPHIRDIQFALPPTSALVSYFTADTVLYSFVITKNRFSVHRSSIDKDFEEQQIGLRKSIQNTLDEDYVDLANQLYQKLFPFTLDSTIQSIVIVSDGALSKLPFEALLSEKVNTNRAIQFNQLPYLLNKYEVSYALSASFYYQKQLKNATTQQHGEGFIAYAPVFADGTEVAFFSRDARNPFSDNESINNSITRERKYIAPLPATKSEVEAIAALFQEKKQKATTFLYQNANEKQLKNSDLQYRNFIHIATHGFINEQQPDLSGLLFFPDTTNQEDNVLYTGEIYNFHLQAQLVVLSACETGLGKVANGEGLLGMSRAFFYAGAQNLLVSLWKVDDQATSDLMIQFYKTYLERQKNKFAQPLRQAKEALIHSKQFSHPKYWSAFVLIER